MGRCGKFVNIEINVKRMKNKQILIGIFCMLFFAPFGIYETNAQEFGLQLYSLRDQFKKDVPGTLKIIGDWGITKVEGANNYGISDKEFMALLKKNGLQITSMDVSFEALQNNPQEIMAKAKAYGSTYVMCPWIPHEGDVFTITETELAVSVFNKAGKLLKEAGISLIYHPHGYEFRPHNGGTLFDYMAQNATHFDFEMDVFWIKHAGVDPVSLLRKYPDQFLTMHLKDRAHGTVGNQNGGASVETNVVLGTGDVGIEAVVKEGKKLGIKYMFLEDESSRALVQIPKSLAFLLQSSSPIPE